MQAENELRHRLPSIMNLCNNWKRLLLFFIAQANTKFIILSYSLNYNDNMNSYITNQNLDTYDSCTYYGASDAPRTEKLNTNSSASLSLLYQWK